MIILISARPVKNLADNQATKLKNILQINQITLPRKNKNVNKKKQKTYSVYIL